MSPCPLASAIVTTLCTSPATNSSRPTSARPPARPMTPGGNRSVGRSRSCSRQVGGSATSTSMPMFIVVPMESTSWATSGVLAIGRFLSSDAKTR